MNTLPFPVLYEDSHIIVCVKPAGTATQTRNAGRPDMVSLLKNHIAASGKEPYLAVIHRLDQPVCGIMVFAKTPFAAKELNRQLTSDGFGKYYRALVIGIPSGSQGSLEDYLIKDGRTNTSRICSANTPGAKKAHLSYRIVPVSERYFPEESADPAIAQTELDIHLDTGRHHQIRVQLANMGCPIAGDRKYNPSANTDTGLTQLKLCSYRLEFSHPKTKKKLSFSLI